MKTTTEKTLTIYDSHAARIRAAHSRHAVTLPTVILLPAFTASNTAAIEAAANSGHAAAYLAIRARHQASGLQLMEDLNRKQAADRQREDLPRIAAEALHEHAQHEKHRDNAEALQAIADRVSTPAEQAAAAAKAAADERRAAALHLARANDLDTFISTTSHSDRADISQAAALAYWQTGDFAAACKAAGKSIGSIAAAKGCTATRTKAQPISAEEAAEIRASYPELERIPFKVREGLTAGYTTIEYRNTKRFPAGWYMVKHYHTKAPYISYEQFASGEAAAQLVTNGGINAIMDEADAAELENLFNRAKLSERERVIVRNMADNTAAAAGIAAVAAHQQQTAERIKAAPNTKAAQRIQREADKQTESIRAAAQRKNAMQRAGVYSDTNQRKALERIRAKLTAAKSAPQEVDPAEVDRRTWAALQANRNRNSSRSQYTSGKPLDLVSAVSTLAAAQPKPETVIAWREDYPKPEAVQAAPKPQQQPQPVGLDEEGRSKYAEELTKARAAAARQRELMEAAQRDGRKAQAADHAAYMAQFESRAANLAQLLSI